jgi:hypothetical protein
MKAKERLFGNSSFRQAPTSPILQWVDLCKLVNFIEPSHTFSTAIVTVDTSYITQEWTYREHLRAAAETVTMAEIIGALQGEPLGQIQTKETCGEWEKRRSYEYDHNSRMDSVQLD